ncbi:MAG: MerR family transcriptional regulator [Melioribacteraceae bacterium]|nr:MerR family transcriptional regulator [Melioribacteraceae bacterium]
MEISYSLKHKPILPIRTAAEMLGVSVHTIRMYEREGLIIPHKSEGNQRQYSHADIERLECIRKAIKELKISINGVKMMYSLLPCWSVVECSEEDKTNCSSYGCHTEPCWAINHPNTTCENRDCRECEVYKDYTKCGEIKELIKKVSKNKL